MSTPTAAAVVVPVAEKGNQQSNNGSGQGGEQGANTATNGPPPHPELEPVLKEEIAKIQPKVEDHTVTVEEANHLHNTEMRAHGYVEKGSVAAQAKSVAMKEANLKQEVAKIESKIESGTVTIEEAARLTRLETRAHGQVEKGGIAEQAMSVAEKAADDSNGAGSNGASGDLEAQLQEKVADIQPKVEDGTVTKDDANQIRSLETRAHGGTEKGSITAQAQSVADQKENTTTGDGANDTPSTDVSNNGNLEAVLQDKVAKIEPKVEDGTVTKDDVSQLRSLDTRVHGGTEKGSVTAQAQSVADRKENASNGDASAGTTSSGNVEVQLQDKVAEVEPKIEDGTVTKDDASQLRALDTRAHGATEKGSVTAQAQSVADKKENNVADKKDNVADKKEGDAASWVTEQVRAAVEGLGLTGKTEPTVVAAPKEQ